MENFVTLFDILFLPQGLALYLSLERHLKNYTLWILCVDDETHEALTKLKLSNVRLLKLSMLETEDLLRVKSLRSKGEYCWTLTPFAPRFVFDADSTVHRVTYIDADLWFRKNPKEIFDELEISEKYVLITDHGYAPEYDQSEISGKYCVQFITFKRGGSELLRSFWEKQCIDWCYAIAEDGKFGDQKYLDDWPTKFSEIVHVMANKELALAPWNAMRFPFGNAVFYHFHGLRIATRDKISVGFYSLPATLVRNVYNPYFQDLKTAEKLAESIGIRFRSQGVVEFLPIRILKALRNYLKTSGPLMSSFGVMKW